MAKSQEGGVMFHRHKWVEQERQLMARQNETGLVYNHYTLILLACQCEKLKTEELAGHWPARASKEAQPA